MVRISKQEERRQKCPRRRKAPSIKTGSLKDNLPKGFKPHANAVQGDVSASYFIPQIQ